MKIVAIILSIYFLGLNTVPCGDSANPENDAQVVLVVDAEGDHGHDCELCSPFCQCHCCHSHTTIFSIMEYEALVELVPKENYSHLDNSYYSYLDSCFHPPKI